MLGKKSSAPRHTSARRYSATGLFSRLADFAELEQRIEALPTPQERGDAFEVFAEAYLNTQKINQADIVWPDGSIPMGIVQQLMLPSTDMGVDGVYQTLSNDLAAYQVKFRTGRKPQTWTELAKFVGLADRADLKVLFTNSDEVLNVVTDRRDLFVIRGADLDRLTQDDLAAIDTWLRGEHVEIKKWTPRPHQVEAINAVLKGLSEHDRVTTVMACGTGKTLTALWLAERLQPRRVLVLLPSLSLVRQTLHEWLKHTRWERPRFMAVCSDPTVTSGTEDVMVVHQADIDFPVTTEHEDVKAFLEAPSDSVQVVFSTYQSARVVGEAMKDQTPFDLGLFDEAHKTAGREGSRFAFALEDANVPIAKRFFMTATPRHYSVHKKDKEGDKKLVYSMDVPEVYGPIVHTLSFAEAAQAGIICDFKTIISVVTSEMINDELLKHGEVLVDGDAVKARSVAIQIALKQACEAHDLRKVFSFHSNVASAKDFTSRKASGIKTHMPDYHALHVNGAMRTAAREMVMREFRDAVRAIISNARCLTEGVDVPAVDVVAFLSPKKSKVDIVQAAGRAMRRSDATGKEYGYLLLPLFLETEAGESVEDALERTGFSEAWNVLQAMQEQDGELADIIREMRVERGRTGGFDDSRLRERVEVLGPEVALETIQRGVSTSIVDHLGITWDERFGELVRYREKYGDCNVPARWAENPQLGGWVSKQREKKNRISKSRLEQLNELGFEWDPYASMWEQRFSELIQYKEEYGDCNVPAIWKENEKLGRWVRTQRLHHETLPKEKVERLSRLGFSWNFLSDTWQTNWEQRFSELVQYKEEHGDCNVPAKWAKNPKLGHWVTNQRARRSKLSAVEILQLQSIGFEWDPAVATWEQRFSELVQYKAEQGDCNVPAIWKENEKLGRWVSGQRSNRENIGEERRKRLDDLGFEWDPAAAFWAQRYSELVDYKAKYGHCNVPRNWHENRRLATWVKTQRDNRCDLAPEQYEMLDKLEFVWDPIAMLWEQRFSELVNYKKENGHCKVPTRQPKYQTLYNWITRQRTQFKRGQLSDERRQRLEELGFEF